MMVLKYCKDIVLIGIHSVKLFLFESLVYSNKQVAMAMMLMMLMMRIAGYHI